MPARGSTKVKLELNEQQILEKYIPGISLLNEEDKEKALGACSSLNIYQINAGKQKIRGKGQDYFSIHEPCRTRTSICDFADLLSYDTPHWQYQNHHFASGNEVDKERSEELADAMDVPKYYSTAPEEFISQYNGDWAGLFIENTFYYASLYSAVHFILNAIEKTVFSWIEQRYPYRIQMNSYLCQENTLREPLYRVEFTTNNQTNNDCAHDARMAYRNFENSLRPKLNQYLNTQTPATYIIYGTDYNGNPTVDLICKNDNTLALIRPARFIEDFMPKTQSPEYLDFLSRKHTKQATDRLLDLGF
ncbi:hypothetical protein [Shewanella sp. TC10]|uniref:hypothetical protein n=1 Tax=Shewanella sp. TC10 TaxID=1419739 RepID=UPI001E29FE7C|nr:hypothetical protein [Shewanella sp. TC10]